MLPQSMSGDCCSTNLSVDQRTALGTGKLLGHGDVHVEAPHSVEILTTIFLKRPSSYWKNGWRRLLTRVRLEKWTTL